MDQKPGPDEGMRRSVIDDDDDTEGQKALRRAIPADDAGPDTAVRRVIVTDDEDDTEGQKVQRR